MVGERKHKVFWLGRSNSLQMGLVAWLPVLLHFGTSIRQRPLAAHLFVVLHLPAEFAKSFRRPSNVRVLLYDIASETFPNTHQANISSPECGVEQILVDLKGAINMLTQPEDLLGTFVLGYSMPKHHLYSTGRSWILKLLTLGTRRRWRSVVVIVSLPPEVLGALCDGYHAHPSADHHQPLRVDKHIRRLHRLRCNLTSELRQVSRRSNNRRSQSGKLNTPQSPPYIETRSQLRPQPGNPRNLGIH
jgi:hypothetical protein